MKKIILILVLLVFIIGCAEKIEKPVEKEEIIKEKLLEEPAQPEVLEGEEIVEEETKDPNLIAHWKFDDDAKDSANNYDGTIKGDATFISGKLGQALSFDGVDDYVEFSAEAVSKIGGLAQGTIAFWFKFSSILDQQTVMPIFYLGVNEKDPDYIFIIEMGHFNERSFAGGIVPDPSNKKLYVTWIKDNKDPFLCYDSNVNLEENKWHHFAVVVSPAGNTGHLNGKELTNRHYNFGNSKDPSFLDDISNFKKMMLGYGRSVNQISPNFVYYKGYLDDFRVYDKALSGEEVKELFK